MTNELQQKLRDILYANQPDEYYGGKQELSEDDAIAAIDAAYQSEGYERLIDQGKSNSFDGIGYEYMTGQEFYERFMSEVMKYEPIEKFYPYYSIEKFAKRAAGISEEDDPGYVNGRF